MKIAVCIKQTFDTEAVIRLDDQGRIESTGVKLIMNPYDEFAVEEALKIKEEKGGEVVAFTVGGSEAKEVLRQALAMGADRAVLINDPGLTGSDHHGIAQALARVLEQEGFDLVLGGWVAIDDGAAQVPARLAELLDVPQVTVVTNLSIDGAKAICHREADGVTEVVETQLPAVITVQKGLNEPRYPNLKGIMQAKKKEIKELDLAELGLSTDQVGERAAKLESLGVFLPEPRKGGKILEGELEDAAKQLVHLLHEEAKVV